MRWWRGWKGTAKRDADLERELLSDLELEEEEQRERGLSAEEARSAARRAFGNMTLIREQTRAAWSWGWLERLVARHEVRHAHATALARVRNRLRAGDGVGHRRDYIALHHGARRAVAAAAVSRFRQTGHAL